MQVAEHDVMTFSSSSYQHENSNEDMEDRHSSGDMPEPEEYRELTLITSRCVAPSNGFRNNYHLYFHTSIIQYVTTNTNSKG